MYTEYVWWRWWWNEEDNSKGLVRCTHWETGWTSKVWWLLGESGTLENETRTCMSAWLLVQYAWPQVANWLFVLKYLMYRVTILPILAAAWIRNSRSCMIHDTHLLSLWVQTCWNHDSIWLSDAYIHIETQVMPDFLWDVNSMMDESWLNGPNGEVFFFKSHTNVPGMNYETMLLPQLR